MRLPRLQFFDKPLVDQPLNRVASTDVLVSRSLVDSGNDAGERPCFDQLLAPSRYVRLLLLQVTFTTSPKDGDAQRMKHFRVIPISDGTVGSAELDRLN